MNVVLEMGMLRTKRCRQNVAVPLNIPVAKCSCPEGGQSGKFRVNGRGSRVFSGGFPQGFPQFVWVTWRDGRSRDLNTDIHLRLSISQRVCSTTAVFHRAREWREAD